VRVQDDGVEKYREFESSSYVSVTRADTLGIACKFCGISADTKMLWAEPQAGEIARREEGAH
jgi:hypothetical protein